MGLRAAKGLTVLGLRCRLVANNAAEGWEHESIGGVRADKLDVAATRASTMADAAACAVGGGRGDR